MNYYKHKERTLTSISRIMLTLAKMNQLVSHQRVTEEVNLLLGCLDTQITSTKKSKRFSNQDSSTQDSNTQNSSSLQRRIYDAANVLKAVGVITKILKDRTTYYNYNAFSIPQIHNIANGSSKSVEEKRLKLFKMSREYALKKSFIERNKANQKLFKFELPIMIIKIKKLAKIYKEINTKPTFSISCRYKPEIVPLSKIIAHSYSRQEVKDIAQTGMLEYFIMYKQNLILEKQKDTKQMQTPNPTKKGMISMEAPNSLHAQYSRIEDCFDTPLNNIEY